MIFMSIQAQPQMIRYISCPEKKMQSIIIIRSRFKGFSLIEMAIVLFIVALLLGGLLPTVSSQIEQQHRTETRKQLEEIQQALIGYAIINGRLPCPADGTTPTGQSNTTVTPPLPAGAEYKNPAATACFNASGVLPWATLGVRETDAWGRRFTYRVSPLFADSTDGSGCTGPITAGVSFQLCSTGLLAIKSSVGGTLIASGIPAVIISHGTDGLGAYTIDGQIIPGATGDQNDNANNANLALNDDNFVSHDFNPTFDDLVVWISPNILLNRMVTAGKLP